MTAPISDHLTPSSPAAPQAVRSVTIAVVLVGAGLCVIVGRDGTPVWQVARVALVVALTAAALAVARGGPKGRPRLGLLGLLGGSVAVAVGVGLAAPHLAKTGITPVSVASLLVLLGGVVLLVVGLAGLGRGRRRLVRYPARALALLVPLLLTATLGQAVAATNVPATTLGDRTPADLDLDHRDVTFAAADGVTLSGWYIDSANGAAVVLLHGAGSTRSAVLDHAAVLARHGYGVLLYDARGHGRSGGRAMDFGWYGDEDVAGAVAFLQDQPAVDPTRIAVVGLSMGGEQAIGAAAAVEGIGAVVAEGATNRVAGDKGWLSEEYGVRGALSEGIERVTYGFADLLTEAGPPPTLRSAVREAGVPTLLIAGGDVGDEPLAARFVQAGAPDSVEVWVMADTGHTAGLRTHPQEWEDRVTGFLGDALGVEDATG